MDIWRDGKIDNFEQEKRQKVVETAQERDGKKETLDVKHIDERQIYRQMLLIDGENREKARQK
jgi:hypothetical protein